MGCVLFIYMCLFVYLGFCLDVKSKILFIALKSSFMQPCLFLLLDGRGSDWGMLEMYKELISQVFLCLFGCIIH